MFNGHLWNVKRRCWLRFSMRRVFRRAFWFFFSFFDRYCYYWAFRDANVVFARLVFTSALCTGLVVGPNCDGSLLLQGGEFDDGPNVRFNGAVLVDVLRDFGRRVDFLVTRGVSPCFLTGSGQVAVRVRRVVLRLGDGACLGAGVVGAFDVFSKYSSRCYACLRTNDRRCYYLRTSRFGVFLFLGITALFGLRVRLLAFAGFGDYGTGGLRRLFWVFH